MIKKLILKLYVVGSTYQSKLALQNLESILKDELPNAYQVIVIDILKNPKLAEKDKIFAVPTVVKKLPPPIRKIVGDLSNKEHVLVGLDIVAKGRKSA